MDIGTERNDDAGLEVTQVVDKPESEVVDEKMSFEEAYGLLSEGIRVITTQLDAAKAVLNVTKDDKQRNEILRNRKALDRDLGSFKLLKKQPKGFYNLDLLSLSDKIIFERYKTALRRAMKKSNLKFLHDKPGMIKTIGETVYFAFDKTPRYSMVFLTSWWEYFSDKRRKGKENKRTVELHFMNLILLSRGEKTITTFFEGNELWDRFKKDTEVTNDER